MARYTVWHHTPPPSTPGCTRVIPEIMMKDYLCSSQNVQHIQGGLGTKTTRARRSSTFEKFCFCPSPSANWSGPLLHSMFYPFLGRFQLSLLICDSLLPSPLSLRSSSASSLRLFDTLQPATDVESDKSEKRPARDSTCCSQAA